MTQAKIFSGITRGVFRNAATAALTDRIVW
jgi:hypothetical protein